MALLADSLSLNNASGTRLKDKVVKRPFSIPGSAFEYQYIPATAQIGSVETSSTSANINRIPGTQQYVNPNASQQEQMHQWLREHGYDDNGNPIGGSSSSSSVNVPTYTQPQAQYRSYDWGDGSQYLTPDNPLVRPVVYNNEFSPESTMSIASDVYNEYYSPIVQEQQRQNTQAYRNAAQEAAAVAGAAGMATGSRGAIQLANQANREAQQTNLQYQQQMQLQAFQDTIDARSLELQNKIQDYQNAWEEVSQYGYVVTEETGALLGIQPGQQLTTLNYKTAMSDIARNVAEINAQKVQLDQQQQQLDQAWIQFQEGVRQYEKDFAENQRQFDLSYRLNKDTTIYDRLTDMLSRYDEVTPEMAMLGAQVGMRMTVGDKTIEYMSEMDRLENTKASMENQTYVDNYYKQQLASQYMTSVQSTGRITNAAQFSSVLADWATQGLSPTAAMEMIDNNSVVPVGGEKIALEDIIGKSNKSKDAAKQLVSSILGGNSGAYDYYVGNERAQAGRTTGVIGTIAGLGLAGLGALTLNPFMVAGGLAGATASGTGYFLNTSRQNELDEQYYAALQEQYRNRYYGY